MLTTLREEDRRIALTGGAALKIRRIGNGPRLEIEDAPVEELASLKAAGCFTEIISWRTRVFLPYDPQEPALSLPVLERVLAILPIAPDPARMAA